MNTNISRIAVPISDAQSSFLTAQPDDTLEKVLPRLQRSHMPIFLYKDLQSQDSFEGLVTLFKAMYGKRYPLTTKLSSITTIPPKNSLRTPLTTICHHILALRCYTLPIWTNSEGEPTHIINDTQILEHVQKDKKLLNTLEEITRIQKPITHSNDTANIKEIFNVLKTHKISRLILTDTHGKVAGIISRSDIMHALIADPAFQRFGKRENHFQYASYFDEEKIKHKDLPITPYVQKKVITLEEDTPYRKIIETMLSKNVPSIVLTTKNVVTGYISRHDVLRAISMLEPKPKVEIVIKDDKDELSDISKNNAYVMLENFTRRHYKKMPMKSIEVVFDTNKNKEGTIHNYEVHAHVRTVKDEIIGGASHPLFFQGLQIAMKKVKSQLLHS